MKPKQRRRLEEQKARKEAELQAEVAANRTQIGSVCTHSGYDNYEAFICSRCQRCYYCFHEIVAREEAGSIKWWRCPDGFEKPSYLDRGQFAPLRNRLSSEGIKWESFG